MTASATPALPDHYAYCEAEVKAADRPTWLASLFAPADKRPGSHALHAFLIEIGSVRDKVREPLAGELRLQWWTDAIEGETRGDVRGHPVAAALLDTIHRYKLSRATLTGIVDAVREDLYDEPVPTLEAFDVRADRIHGAAIGVAARLLGGADSPLADAANQAGRAVAVADAIRALSRPAARMAVRIPLALLRANGIGTAEVTTRRSTPAVAATIAALRAHADAATAALRRGKGTIGPDAAPAFLTANFVPPMLRKTARRGFDPFTDSIDLPQWRQQWIMWRAAGRNGVL